MVDQQNRSDQAKDSRDKATKDKAFGERQEGKAKIANIKERPDLKRTSSRSKRENRKQKEAYD